jgi:hypothetical protein
MQWREVVEHPSLKDLPFEMETNKWATIMPTRVFSAHGKNQRRTALLFECLGEGRSVSTLRPIKISKGTRVADSYPNRLIRDYHPLLSV